MIIDYEYLFTVTGVKKMKWFLSLMRCHFSDRRSRMAGNGTDCEVKTIELSSPTSGGEQCNELFLISLISLQLRKLCQN